MVTKKYSLALLLILSWATEAWSYTANQVSFEFRPNGIYRVYMYYTVPALKEFREATVEFTSRKKAEKYYYDVLRGAEFYLDEQAKTDFINEPLAPSPW